MPSTTTKTTGTRSAQSLRGRVHGVVKTSSMASVEQVLDARMR
jgi:hypothetical protein